MSDLVRANHTQVTIKRPDGSTFEYSGPAEELSVILSQLDKRSSIQWAKLATNLRKYQPLFLVGAFAILSVWLMLWTLRPTPEYRPQSHGGSYGIMG
ncbi:MAG: hypothetical protein ACFB2W_00720 [Leptolyngbyaceae cyanobacterium]